MSKYMNLRTVAIAIVLVAVVVGVILAGTGDDLAGTGGGKGKGNNGGNGGGNGGNGGGNGQATDIPAPTDVAQQPTSVPATNVPAPTEDNRRYSFCHIAGRADDPANFIIMLNRPYQNYRGHFEENGTPSAGHEQDFIINGPADEARCAPQATPVPPTNVPPTNVPPTNAPPTNVSPTEDNRRYSFCHVAGRADDPANFIIMLDRPYQNYRGHFEENGTPSAGHEQDFIINGPADEARCAPQATPVPPTNTPRPSNTPGGPTNTPNPPTNTPDGGRVVICHVAGRADAPANYVVLTLPLQALRGHFDENGTQQAGHEQDFFINGPEDLARCQAPTSTPRPTNTPRPSNTPGNTPPPTNTPDGSRIVICHVAGRADAPANYIILTLPYQAFRGHFDENGTQLAGHEQDFIINGPEDAARCQAPTATPEPTATYTPTNTPTNTPTPLPCDGRNSCSEIQVRAACVDAGTGSPVASFSIVNVGPAGEGDMAEATGYRLFLDGEQVDSGTVQLAGGESLDLQLVGVVSGTAGIEADQESDYPGASTVSVEISLDCVVPTPTPSDTPEPTSTPTKEPKCGITYDEKGFPIPLPDVDCGENEGPTATPTPEDQGWVAPAKGPAICEDWLVYHTDMTGDWEIFRLGDLPDGKTGDPNLSKGTEAFDVAPSRSPDALNIAFASNRDGNWEIYIAAVDGSLTERVTYNSQAIDIDPVWSPNNDYIAYESNRLGNWEVYMVNVDTGVETQLTNDAGNDLNPYFAPDGSKLLFQSDRDGFWQIYEYNLSSGETTLISDGTTDDHDPQYSFDGTKILFRSYRESENSAIYVANADGSDVELISDVEGNATNQVWAPNDVGVAYQSDLDGDLDIYVYEFESKATRLVTDNDIADYAPTWICNSPTVVFTSDITEDPNIFSTGAFPIDAPAVKVESEASQLTTDPANDQYPQNSPAEENASRQGSLPSPERNRALGAN